MMITRPCSATPQAREMCSIGLLRQTSIKLVELPPNPWCFACRTMSGSSSDSGWVPVQAPLTSMHPKGRQAPSFGQPMVRRPSAPSGRSSVQQPLEQDLGQFALLADDDSGPGPHV